MSDNSKYLYVCIELNTEDIRNSIGLVEVCQFDKTVMDKEVQKKYLKI